MKQLPPNFRPLVGCGAADSFLWLAFPIFCGPGLALWAFMETDGTANAFRSLADSMIMIIPALALAAAITSRMTPRVAAIATLVFVVLDSLGARGILHELTRGIFHQSENPSWMSVAIILFATAVLAGSTLLRATLSRIVMLVVALAQIVVLAVFHQLLVIAPIDAERENEAHLMSDYVAIHGSPEGLCGVDGRLCYAGTTEELAQQISEKFPHPDAITRILHDTASRDRLLHVWTEMILPSTNEEGLRHVAVFKQRRDAALVVVNETGPTRSFTVAKGNFGILASMFHEAWVSIALLIIWRHGDFKLRRGRWVRS